MLLTSDRIRPWVQTELEAGLVDEVILHQVPVLLGAGRSFFHELPEHVNLRLLQAIPAPGTGFTPTFYVATAVADYVAWRADHPR